MADKKKTPRKRGSGKKAPAPPPAPPAVPETVPVPTYASRGPKGWHVLPPAAGAMLQFGNQLTAKSVGLPAGRHCLVRLDIADSRGGIGQVSMPVECDDLLVRSGKARCAADDRTVVSDYAGLRAVLVSWCRATHQVTPGFTSDWDSA